MRNARTQREHVREPDAARERALARMLDHRAIGHRIGERHAELDQIGAGVDERVHDRDRRVGRRIAGGDERDQAGASGGFEFGEALVDATSDAQSIPSRAAIVCTSLSPRPDRFTRINLSFAMFARELDRLRDRVARFERRQNAFGARQLVERRERFVVGDADVALRGRCP